MKLLRKFWWVLAIGAAVWWYKKRTPDAYNGVPKYLDPNSKGQYLPGVGATDFSQPLF